MHAPRPSSRRAPAPWAAVALSLLAVLATASAAGPAGPEIVSVTAGGIAGDGGSSAGAVTPNGRYVAFTSDATNLVPGDTNQVPDVFVRDRGTGTTARVSVDSDGNEGNSGSSSPSISANGQFIVFSSSATNLVPGDTGSWTDVFVHDAKTGVTTRVSTAEDGTEGNRGSYVVGATISSNGRWVTFFSDATNLVPGGSNGARAIFVRDLKRGTIMRVSVDSDGNQGSAGGSQPSISANGRFVAFYAFDSNLVPGDTNGARDTFVHDLRTGETRRVSVDSAGQQGNGDSYDPALPSNGKFVVFHSDAANLVPGDTNGTSDVFLHDLRTGETRRLSVDAQGNEGNDYSFMDAASLSPNGRFLAFHSGASNFAAGDVNGASDVFLLDLR